MAQVLRQSTAIEVKVGPFLDNVDGFTAETGLTITSAEVLLAKNAGDWGAKNEATSLVHESNGWYRCLLDTTDTNTLGMLLLQIAESGALPVWETFWVVTANVYDSLFSTDVLDVNVTQWLGAAPNALATGRVDASVGAMAAGVLTAAAIAADAITAAKVAADVSAEIADAVLDEDMTGHQTQGTLGQAIGDPVADTNTIYKAVVTDATGATVGADVVAVQSDTDDIQARLPAALVSGRMDSHVGSVADAVLTAAKFAAGAFDAVWTVATRVLTAATNISGPIADQVWDEAGADHVASGSFGQRLAAIRAGTAQGGAAGSITLDSGASASDDFYNNDLLVITAGTGAGQARFIEDYTGSSKVATVTPNWVTAPDATSVFVILPFDDIPGASAPTAAQVADAVWDEAVADHVAAGSTGERQERLDIIATGGASELTPARAALLSNADAAVSSRAVPGDAMALTSGERTTLAGVIWDRLTSALTLAGSIGKLLVDNVNATIGSRAVPGDSMALTSAARAAVVDEVWDEAQADHVAAGSMGERHERLDIIASGGAGELTPARAALLSNADAAVSSRATPAQVNAEVVDALSVDTYTEPGQETPPVTTSLATKISHVYKAYRNRGTQSSTEFRLYAAGGVTVDQKAPVSDSGGVTDRGELTSGP